MLATWAEQVPPAFRFVLKASRRITHNSRLKDDDGSLAYFLRAVNPLGNRLGPTLFQLPPTFKQDVDRLRNFLSLLPRRLEIVLHFHAHDVHSAFGLKNQKAGAARGHGDHVRLFEAIAVIVRDHVPRRIYTITDRPIKA